MVNTAERLYSLLCLTLEQNNPVWLQNTIAELGERSYRLYPVESTVEAIHKLASKRIHAIICIPTPETERFLEKMWPADVPTTDRPIIVMLTPTPLNSKLEALCDVVLPPGSTYFIDVQVKKLLSARQYISALQQDRNEINLLKNAIVRNVSHELKTPLLQVKSAVALLREDAPPNDKLVNMAVIATTRLETVIKNITLLADSLNTQFGPALVHEAINQAARNLRRSWEHKNAISRIQYKIDPDLPPVLADNQGLAIVMQQLIDNALKFSQEHVEIRARRVQGGVEIAVADHGIGIADDKRKQIFESFYQIDNSTTRQYGGTGVGLAIVRLITEKHNTEIKVTSELGEGSTFSFCLQEANIEDF